MTLPGFQQEVIGCCSNVQLFNFRTVADGHCVWEGEGGKDRVGGWLGTIAVFSRRGFEAQAAHVSQAAAARQGSSNLQNGRWWTRFPPHTIQPLPQRVFFLKTLHCCIWVCTWDVGFRLNCLVSVLMWARVWQSNVKIRSVNRGQSHTSSASTLSFLTEK